MLGVKKSQINLLIIVILEACGQKKRFFVFFRFRKCYNLAGLGLGSLTLELVIKHSGLF